MTVEGVPCSLQHVFFINEAMTVVLDILKVL